MAASSFFMAPALIKRGVTALAPHVLASPFFLHPSSSTYRINNNMTQARDKGGAPWIAMNEIHREQCKNYIGGRKEKKRHRPAGYSARALLLVVACTLHVRFLTEDISDTKSFVPTHQCKSLYLPAPCIRIIRAIFTCYYYCYCC